MVGTPTVAAESSSPSSASRPSGSMASKGRSGVELTGLPAGYHRVTSPIVIEAGQNNALGVITAASDAAAPIGCGQRNEGHRRGRDPRSSRLARGRNARRDQTRS